MLGDTVFPTVAPFIRVRSLTYMLFWYCGHIGCMCVTNTARYQQGQSLRSTGSEALPGVQGSGNAAMVEIVGAAGAPEGPYFPPPWPAA